MHYPFYRPRRLRQNQIMRRMIRETRLSVDNLVMPFFVCAGKNLKSPIESMPGQFQLSVDSLVREAEVARDAGIPAIILFGIPLRKDSRATEAYRRGGIVQKAVGEIKKHVTGLAVITDVCLCEYMDHGHCGVVKRNPKSSLDYARDRQIPPRLRSGQANPKHRSTSHESQTTNHDYYIDNDATLELLAKTALSHAEAGADMVAPSAMMDGQVRAIRTALDGNGYSDTPIMSYSAKYASSFYAPFREAAESPPQFGDRSSYQMDVANSDEALREVELDINEGADIVMVKPALAYLDIVRKIRDQFNVPLAAYNVSGEYSMVKAAARAGWIDEKKVVIEILTSIRRAGADIVITYHALDAARWLKNL
ncbi:MAG: porphobilinogen synthase [Candidatus Aureabacteria bacterium]|nr:porphobilinogen synthase [Candidatus Auribacterota bacterium]